MNTLQECWLQASKRCAGAAFGARGFLGRTLLLRLQGYQTCAGAGILAPGLANAVLVQHLVLGGVCGLRTLASLI